MYERITQVVAIIRTAIVYFSFFPPQHLPVRSFQRELSVGLAGLAPSTLASYNSVSCSLSRGR